MLERILGTFPGMLKCFDALIILEAFVLRFKHFQCWYLKAHLMYYFISTYGSSPLSCVFTFIYEDKRKQ